MELTPLRLCIYSINIYQNPCFFKRQYQVPLIILNIILSLEYLSISNNFLFKLLASEGILHGLLLSEHCARHFVSDSDSYVWQCLCSVHGHTWKNPMGHDPRDKRGWGRIFKGLLLQVQEWHILMNRKSIKDSRKLQVWTTSSWQ